MSLGALTLGVALVQMSGSEADEKVRQRATGTLDASIVLSGHKYQQCRRTTHFCVWLCVWWWACS